MPQTCAIHVLMRLDFLSVNARRDHGLGVQLVQSHLLVHRGHGFACRHDHARAKVARCLAVRQVAPSVTALGFDERQVGMDGRFVDVHAAIDFAGSLSEPSACMANSES
jgi:hypothetical protein